MDLVTINKEQLRKLFVEAYEAGWYGCKELAEQTANELVDRAGQPATDYELIEKTGKSYPHVSWDGSMGTWQYPEGYVSMGVDPAVFREAQDGTAVSEDEAVRVEVIAPPQTIEIVREDGQTFQIAGWEIHLPSTLFPDSEE